MSETITYTEINELLDRIKPIETGDTANFNDWLRFFPRDNKPAFRKARLELFAAHHGDVIADHGRERACYVSENYLQQCLSNQAPIARLCQDMDADLRVYEMDLETPTRDRRHEPAMSEDEMVRAMSYGMMAIAPDADIYAMGAFGAGSRECAEALLDYEDTPLNLLQNRGGLEICALAGAVLATRLAGLALLLEAPQGLGALHALGNHIPSIGQHCCVVYTGHNSQTLPAPAGKAQTLTIEDRLPQHPGIACAMGLNRVRALGPVIDAEHASEIDKQKQQSESCNDMREDT